MGILANLSGKDAVNKFKKFGYTLDHQTGSHMIMYHKELAPGLLRGLIRKSDLTVEQFLKARK
ncbi:MAG: type II toxin-antitoxin system HicA family toxin [Desulfotomaculum sp.]|nr:type II toxin-antitoxin system HicA family toxin [Desulfotomaculum sp.]